jgi:hypothetical protein
MNVTLRRSFAGALGLSGALAVSATLMLGCAAPARPAAAAGARTAAPAAPPRLASGADRETTAQRHAQVSWCNYLKALYLRADTQASAWPRFEECVGVKSTASPRLLEQTAECSLRALNAFAGDPFTVAYASEVSRCGVEALEVARISRPELEPFLSALCRRMGACEQLDYAECTAAFEPSVIRNLERAVGALNQGGRDELHACLGGASCEAIDVKVSRCLEPILDRMLWLPD